MNFLACLGCLIVLRGSYICHAVSEMLCVKAQLPTDKGGLESSVIFIDGGNTLDPYLIADLSRQYDINIGQALRDIKVSRAFTYHQLVSLISEKLPEALKIYNSRLVIISDILYLFNDVESEEAGRILNRITHFLSELAKKENIIVVATCLNHARGSMLESYLTSRADIVLDVLGDGDIHRITLEKYIR